MRPPTLNIFPSQPMHVDPSTKVSAGLVSPATSGSKRSISEPSMELSNPRTDITISGPEPPNKPVKTFIRLAQNREAVRKSRLRKKGQHDDIRESAILEGYRCKDDGCFGFLLRDSDDRGFICQECGLVRKKEEIKNLASELKLISDQAMKSKSLPRLDYPEAISMYKMIEKLQMKLCHPFSVNLMRTREDLLKILMEHEDWNEALECCRLTIPVYERLYPGFHPLLGLQYYTCGKLEWLLGDTEGAIKSLTKAVDILKITHGTNTSFMKELLIKLEEARAEASYKLSSIAAD